MIYLDNNATTRVAPEVFDAMRPFLTEVYGNPSSAHSLGKEMKSAVEQARGRVAQLIGAADTNEIVFTSCGSEADNWAISGFLEQNPGAVATGSLGIINRLCFFATSVAISPVDFGVTRSLPLPVLILCDLTSRYSNGGDAYTLFLQSLKTHIRSHGMFLLPGRQ